MQNIKLEPCKESTSIFPPVDPSNPTNGNSCYYCDGQNCLNTVKCSGNEDRCIKATGENLETEED